MTGVTVADVLDAAADLLTPEGAWTQKALARNGLGCTVSPKDHDAACWCLMGATERAAFDLNLSDREARKARFQIREIMPNSFYGIPEWNDQPDRTKDEVTFILREAANAARATSKEASHD